MPDQRALVFFPQGSGRYVIESLRRSFDPLATAIAAHATLVFPFASEISDADLRAHVEQALAGQPPFRVRFEGVSEAEEDFSFSMRWSAANDWSTSTIGCTQARLPSIGQRRTSTGHTSRSVAFETGRRDGRR